MTRKSTIRTVTFALAATAVAIAVAVVGWVRAHQTSTELDEGYRRAYAQLSSDLSQMDSALQKLTVSGSTETRSLCAADVWMHASAAEQCLETLPMAGNEFTDLETYINRVGDYAYSLLRRCAAGDTLTPEEREVLTSLSAIAGEITTALQDPASANLDPSFFRGVAGAASGLSDALMNMESDFPESPVLIYDGPFSDHILSATPACVAQNPEPVSADTAIARAAKIFSVPAESIELLGEAGGQIPAWCLSFQSSAGTVSLQMAKNSGDLLLLLCAREDGESKLTHEEALAAANGAASALGFQGLKSTYYYEEGGVLYVNFAAMDGDVCLYPDLVQLGISLSDGTICYAEARGYLANHRQRELTPSLTLQEAESKLYSEFSVLDSRLCLIPTSGKNERLCYEFHTKSGDREYLVYIDAHTGSEAQILQLLRSDNGILTM